MLRTLYLNPKSPKLSHSNPKWRTFKGNIQAYYIQNVIPNASRKRFFSTNTSNVKLRPRTKTSHPPKKKKL